MPSSALLTRVGHDQLRYVLELRDHLATQSTGHGERVGVGEHATPVIVRCPAAIMARMAERSAQIVAP